MSHTRNARREFLRRLSCMAVGGGAAALIPQLRMLGTALAASAAQRLRRLPGLGLRVPAGRQ